MSDSGERGAERDQTILVAGHPFRGYVRMVASGFSSHGIQCDTLEWRVPERTFSEHLGRMVSSKLLAAGDLKMSMANALALEKAILEKKPNYVLAMNGGRITPATRRFCSKEGIRLALWAHDSAHHFPWIAEASHDYDLIYTYEPGDLDILSENAEARFLPLAYDPNIYHTANVPPQDVLDICFVGAIRGSYPRRTEILRLLVRKLRTQRIEIWSDWTPWYSPFRLQDLKIVGMRRNLKIRRHSPDHSDINKLYNRSRICLNIHHDQARRAVNPRTFEILGSGGFLLTDKKLDGIPNFVEGRDYVLYTDLDDLASKTYSYLQDGERRLKTARSGHSVAASDHTYSSRAAKILDGFRQSS